MANHACDVDEWSSPVVSRSFKTDRMIIAPCNMKTLAGIANRLTENVILRAADVAPKEKRKLFLVIRENPLNTIHL